MRNQILSVLEMHRRPRVFEMPPLQYPVKRTSRVPVSVNEAPCRLLEIQGMSVCTFWKVDHNEYVLGRKISRENHELGFFKLGEARENLIPGFSLNKRNKMPSPKTGSLMCSATRCSCLVSTLLEDYVYFSGFFWGQLWSQVVFEITICLISVNLALCIHHLTPKRFLAMLGLKMSKLQWNRFPSKTICCLNRSCHLCSNLFFKELKPFPINCEWLLYTQNWSFRLFLGEKKRGNSVQSTEFATTQKRINFQPEQDI